MQYLHTKVVQILVDPKDSASVKSILDDKDEEITPLKRKLNMLESELVQTVDVIILQ